MNMNKNPNYIIDFFNELNSSGIRYVLLRNIDNELPYNYKSGNKDIDILVHPKDKSLLHSFMKKKRFVSYPHPLDKGRGLTYLYAVDSFEFYKKDGYIFDVCFQMVCKSPNNGEYMPLDQIVNNYIWDSRRKNEEYGWYELCDEDLMIHLLTRCIFDKKEFKDAYKNQILSLYQTVDMLALKQKMDLVFFKYTDTLLDKIKQNDFKTIIDGYYSFTNY